MSPGQTKLRRLGALAITIWLAWLVLVRLGDESGSATALGLGVALVSASIVGWLFEFLRLPRITGYLILGLLCGPAAANLITEPMARDLRVVSGFAIGIIAFIAGLQLNFASLKPRIAAIVRMSAITVVVALAGMAATVFILWRWLPFGAELSGLQRAAASALVGTLLIGVSPILTTAVIAESRARGSLATLGTAVVVCVELLVIVAFAICLQVARTAFGTQPADELALALFTVWVILGSVAFGGLLGSLFAVYLRYVGREVTVVLLALFALFTGLGAQLRFDPLLSGLSEEAARKRVNRAVEQLRGLFSRRGVVVPAGMLGVMMSEQMVRPVSAEVIAGATAAAEGGAVAGSVGLLAKSAGLWLTWLGLKPVAMAVTRDASSRLARPITAFCSWITVGILRSVAASTGGTVG